ncbi:MAG: hypothetical protein AAF517_13810 [Planctomycetota bacterium]
MRLSPSTIIDESRRLEGCAVDLGPGRELTDVERESLLARLTAEIDTALGSLEHAQLVDRYNKNLYVHMDALEFHQQPLPIHTTLCDELTLILYLEFEKELKEKGPATLADSWRLAKTVAHVRVIETERWRWRHEKFSTEPLHVYKGEFPRSRRFRDGNWGQTYYPENEYVVFWLSCHPTVIGSAMRLSRQGDVRVVRNDRSGVSFWPFDAELVPGERVSQVAWSDLHDWLSEKAAEERD